MNVLEVLLCSRKPLYTLSLVCVYLLIPGLVQNRGGVMKIALETIVGLATGLPGN